MNDPKDKMEADDLEKPYEEIFQPETNQMKEYQICLKSIHKSHIKKIKKNIKNYRRMLLEEQNRLLKEQKILQNRLQKYFNLESELKQLFSKIPNNSDINIQELNEGPKIHEDQFKTVDFIINLQSKK